MTNAERKLLIKVARRNPEFAKRFLESLTPAEPKQAAPQQQAQQVAPQPAPPAGKITLLGKLLDKLGLGSEATKKTLAQARKIGVGAAGTTLIYQALDNIGDLANGRDPASSAYGIITDNFTNWRAAVEPVSDVLSSPLVGLGAALGVGFVWGRKAWRQLKKAWTAAAESVERGMVLANEKLTERVKVVAEFVKSASKAAFVALTCYHLPNLMGAGRSLVEVEPNSDALGQVHQIANQFFTAAPGTTVPVFAYILAAVAQWLTVSLVMGILEPGNNRKREQILEEQRRLKAEPAATTADAQAAPPANHPEGPTPT
ncbi:MAG: hypothetical protein WC350_01850 [Candidatus Micrarchaeia archaeon]|jgi:hypothetical protein